MRTVLIKEPNGDEAIKVTIKLLRFAERGYEVKGMFEYPLDKGKTISYTISPNPYYCKVVYKREVDNLKTKGYVIETEEED